MCVEVTKCDLCRGELPEDADDRVKCSKCGRLVCPGCSEGPDRCISCKYDIEMDATGCPVIT